VNHYTEHQDFQEAILVVDHLGEPDRGIQVRSSATSLHGQTYIDVACLRHLQAST
jgi:hypothetical protein